MKLIIFLFTMANWFCLFTAFYQLPLKEYTFAEYLCKAAWLAFAIIGTYFLCHT